MTTAAAETYQIQCAEIWGGIAAHQDQISTPGVHAALHSSAGGDARGGDLYYFSVCSYDTLTRIAVADVRGHGEAVSHLSEWLYASLERRMNDPDGAAVLADLNGIVREKGFSAITTAVVATLHRDQGTLQYCYAGHPPLFHYRPAQGWAPLTGPNITGGPSNLPLGVLPGTHYAQETVRVHPGDRLFLYTDGVSECPGPDDALFGDSGLATALHSMRTLPLPAARSAMQHELSAYSGGPLTHDDCTFLFLEVRPPLPFWKRRILPGRRR